MESENGKQRLVEKNSIAAHYLLFLHKQLADR